MANDLGLNIGDSLTFVINSQTVEATVDSIRRVEWREMKPNFYFIFSEDALADVAATWLVSFRLEDSHNQMIDELSRNYPTVSLMDIREMGSKIQELLRQVAWAISVLASLGVFAGVLLIFTLLRLSLSQRQQEIQLYRTLGASRKRVVNTVWAEYGTMALVAGSVAALGAEIAVAALVQIGFELEPRIHIFIWFALPIATFCTLFLVVSSLLNRLLTL